LSAALERIKRTLVKKPLSEGRKSELKICLGKYKSAKIRKIIGELFIVCVVVVLILSLVW